jgi:hypothetical protein
MLNRFFFGPLGFAWGVRASALLCLGLLILGNGMMSTNPAVMTARKAEKIGLDMKGILLDLPFMITCFGLVASLIYFLWVQIHL